MVLRNALVYSGFVRIMRIFFDDGAVRSIAGGDQHRLRAIAGTEEIRAVLFDNIYNSALEIKISGTTISTEPFE